MNITQHWRKVMAVGCSHAIYADPVALQAVLQFRRSFKPDRCFHLGDAFDLTSLRSGAHGGKDEAVEIQPDIDAGVELLTRLEPTDFLLGNHEGRLQELMGHFNAKVAFAAQKIMGAVTDLCRGLQCRVVPYSGIYQAVMLGGVRYMHGAMFNENAVRDHAETFGPVVFAHTHRAGMATGRRSDSPLGFCVGTLTKRENMDYAKSRRSTLGWSQGFVYGFYNDKRSQLWLHEQPQGATSWRLPS